MLIPIDYLVGATLFLYMQAAGKMAEEVAWLFAQARQKLGEA